MGRAAKIAVGAALAGLLMALALVSAIAPARPGASAPPISGADAPLPPTPLPARCRTASVSDPECDAAWEAKRRRFFGQEPKP